MSSKQGILLSSLYSEPWPDAFEITLLSNKLDVEIVSDRGYHCGAGETSSLYSAEEAGELSVRFSTLENCVSTNQLDFINQDDPSLVPRAND